MKSIISIAMRFILISLLFINGAIAQSSLTSRSYFNTFTNANINDDNQTTTTTSGANLTQASGDLNVNFTSFNQFNVALRTQFATPINFSGNGVVWVRMRSNVALNLQVRLADNSGFTSSGDFNTFSVPNTGVAQWYRIDLNSRFSVTDFDENNIIRFELFRMSGATLSAGALTVEEVWVGNAANIATRNNNSLRLSFANAELSTNSIIGNIISTGSVTQTIQNGPGVFTASWSSNVQFQNLLMFDINAGNFLNLVNTPQDIVQVRIRMMASVTGINVKFNLQDNNNRGGHPGYLASEFVFAVSNTAYTWYSVNLNSSMLASSPQGDRTQVKRLLMNMQTNIAAGSIMVDSLVIGREIQGSNRSPFSLVHKFNGETWSDNNISINASTGVNMEQGLSAGTMRFNIGTVNQYQTFGTIDRASGTRSIDLRYNATVAVRLRTSANMNLQFRLVDSAGNTTGDWQPNSTQYGGNTNWSTFTIDFTSRINAVVNMNPARIVRLEIRNYNNGAVTNSWIEIDSVRIGFGKGGSVLTSRSFVQRYDSVIIQDENLVSPTFAGTVQLNGGILRQTLSNQGSFTEITNMPFRAGRTINLSNDATFILRARATNDIAYQVRILDANNNSTGDFGTFNIPGTNVWTTFGVDFSSRLRQLNVNPANISRIQVFCYTPSYSGTIEVDSFRVGNNSSGNSIKTATSFIYKFGSAVLNDDNHFSGVALSRTPVISSGELQIPLSGATQFTTMLSTTFKGNSISLFNNAQFVMRARNTNANPVTFQLRLVDSANASTGDHANFNIVLPANSGLATYTLDVAARIAAQGLNINRIRGFSFVMMSAGSQSGTVFIDSIALGRDGNSASEFTSGSWSNYFPGTVLNDNNQLTTGDAGILQNQNNGTLSLVMNSFPAYQRVYRMAVRTGVRSINAAGYGGFSIRIRTNTNAILQVRMIDTNNIQTNDQAGSYLFITGDNQWNTYTINLEANAPSNFDFRKVRIFEIYNWDIARSGTIEIDSLLIGQRRLGFVYNVLSKEINTPFGGAAWGGDDQITARAESGGGLTQSNFLTNTVVSYTAGQIVAGFRLQRWQPSVNLNANAVLRIKVRSNVATTLWVRLSDTNNVQTTSVEAARIVLGNSNTFQEYVINLMPLMNAQGLIKSKIRALDILTLNNLSNAIISFDDLKIGDENSSGLESRVITGIESLSGIFDTIQIQSGAILSLNGLLTVQKALIIEDNGTLETSTQRVNGLGTLLVKNNATIVFGNTQGINNTLTSAISLNGLRTFEPNWNATFSNAQAMNTGNAFPNVVGNLEVNNANLSLTNSLEVNGTITLNGVNLVLNGHKLLQKQTLQGSGFVQSDNQSEIEIVGNSESDIATAFNPNAVIKNLKVNKTGSGKLLISSTIIVNDTLQLSQGLVNTSNSSLIIVENDGLILGGSAQSFVEGPLAKKGNTNCLLPLGKGAIYAPLALSFPFGTLGNSTFRAEYFATPGLHRNSLQNLALVSGREHWDLSRIEGTDSVIASLYWNDGGQSQISDLSDLKVAHYNSTINAWENMGGQTTGTLSQGNVRSTKAFTNFSPITFGSENGNNPLPVTWLSFNVSAQNGIHHIKWQTANELNNKGFEIYQSNDGKNFKLLGFINGKGNSNTTQSYAFEALATSNENYYYYIKQIDFDGRFSLSPVLSINHSSLAGDAFRALVFPNPSSTNGATFIKVEGNERFEGIIYLSMKDVNGREVWKNEWKGYNHIQQIPTHLLNNGVYAIELLDGFNKKTMKLVVK